MDERPASFSRAGEAHEVPMQDVQEPASAGKAPVSAGSSWLIRLERHLRGVRMPTAEKLVLFVLAGHADVAGMSWPAQETLARETGLGLSKLGDALRELAARRWIRRWRVLDGGRVWASTRYQLALDGEGWPAEKRPPRGGRRSVSGTHNGVGQQASVQDTDIVECLTEERPVSGKESVPRRAPTKLPEEKLPQEAPRREAPTQIAHAREGARDEDEGRGGSPSPVVMSSPPSPIGQEAKGKPLGASGRVTTSSYCWSCLESFSKTLAKCPRCGAERLGSPLGGKPKTPPAGTTPPLPGLEDVAAAPPAPDPVPEVWAAFLAERQRHLGPTAGRLPVLDDKRRTIIARALKSYSIEDVCAAVRGIWRDGFHREKDWKYATIEVALRDASHIEQFRELGASAPAAPQTEAVPPKRDEPRLPPGPRRSPEELKAVWEMFKHEAGGQEWLGGGA